MHVGPDAFCFLAFYTGQRMAAIPSSLLTLPTGQKPYPNSVLDGLSRVALIFQLS